MISGVLLAAALSFGVTVSSTQTPAINPTPLEERKPQGLPLGSESVHPSSSLGAIESKLRNDLKTNSKSYKIIYQLALVLRQENKPEESLQMYTQAASIEKPDADQLRSVALDYVLLNDYGAAIHWLERASAIDPNNLDVLYDLGRCFYTQSRFHEAETIFTRVLTADPEHIKAEENLGLTYDAENKPDKAEPALRHAAELAEKLPASDPWPFLDLGGFLLEQGRAVAALPFLTRAKEISPNLAISHEKLGHALVTAGNPADGIRELKTAIKLDPRNPKTHFELGRAYHNAGDQEAATKEFAVSKSLYGATSHD